MFVPRNRRRGNNAQVQGMARLDLDNPLQRNLLLASYFSGEDAYLPPYNYVNGTVGSSVLVGTDTSAKGVSPSFNGTTSKAQIAVDLGTNRKITLALWLYWDSYSSNGDVALSYGVSWSENNGFLFQPNVSNGSMFVGVGSPSVHYAGAFGTPPSSGVWRYYQVYFNRDDTAFGTDGVWEDGVSVMNNSTNFSFAASDFGPGPLQIMALDGSSAFGAGKIQCLTIHAGHLADDLRVSQQLNPWQLVKPVERPPHPASPVIPRQPMIWMSP